MRRLTGLVLSLTATATLSCVSSTPAGKAPTPYPLYKISPVPHTHADSHPPVIHESGLPRRVPRADSPDWYPPGGRISRRWTTIVLHHSATESGGAVRFDRHHRLDNGWDELGYHFVIGNGTDTPDGYVEVGPRWRKQKHGAHCKTRNNYYNEHGIGICLVGDFTHSTPTPRQLAALTRLTRFLCEACDIPPERITTHRAVTRKTKCPGRRFPLAALVRAVRKPSAVAWKP